ncbi:short-chain dehydrogenase [Marinobacter lipolyticus SM19]|uniref:Short-chain dehydrogenase n=1 Tax=Marinobacter lipolyticus SM19 TaxID=1318628 RepID=R8B351_9GAMM|nr:short-chain dehydrogenase [Marinobacter lipolyticus]EON93017.1 short-chain dehydrogenase [Marinobacter lipolyticus SM19]
MALINAPGQSQGYLGLVSEELDLDRRVAARFALLVGLYSPVRALKTIEEPILMQVGLNDVITPAQTGIKAAQKFPTVELKTYDSGHFEPYQEPLFSFVLADQLDFLNRKLHI